MHTRWARGSRMAARRTFPWKRKFRRGLSGAHFNFKRRVRSRATGLAAALDEQAHLGNGPATMGPESTGDQVCLQWAHWTSRSAAWLAPERVSNATEFLFRH